MAQNGAIGQQQSSRTVLNRHNQKLICAGILFIPDLALFLSYAGKQLLFIIVYLGNLWLGKLRHKLRLFSLRYEK
jgi:hypothetical protein